MGAVCTKGCSSSDILEGGQRRNYATSSVNNHADDIFVSLECFCVPLTRLMPQPFVLEGPGAACRSVVVTTISIEKRQESKRELNSAIYTPALQWLGIEVKEQVPKFLPMNLWPGTYTVFGFFNADFSSSCHVKLVGKIGSDQICLEEQMDTEKCLASEEWSDLSKVLEKELEKVNLFSSKQKRAYDTVRATKMEHFDANITDYEKEKRVSRDTGYLSTKASLDQPVIPAQSLGHTPDSDDCSVFKDSQAEQKLRMRRKDTPAHNTLHIQFTPIPQEFQDFPLEEESDDILGSDNDDKTPLLRADKEDLGDGNTSPQQEVGLNEDSNIIDNDRHTSPMEVSVSKPDQSTNETIDKKPTPRKKKRSIIAKIGAISTKDDLNSSEVKKVYQGDESDLSGYADDEADPSLSENIDTDNKLPVDAAGCGDGNRTVDIEMPIVDVIEEDKPSKCQDDENIAIKKTSLSLENEEPLRSTAKTELSDKKSVYPEKDSKESKDSAVTERNKNIRKFSFSQSVLDKNSSKAGETQKASTLQGKQDNILGDVTDEVEDNTSNNSHKNNRAKDENINAIKKLERRRTTDYKEPMPRSRSRTFSRKKTDESEDRTRYTRPSKSVSLPKENMVSRRVDKGGKTACLAEGIKRSNINSDLSNIPEPPLTPKEAFSDHQE